MHYKCIFLISHYQVNLNKATQALTPLRNLKINTVGNDRHSEGHADSEEADHVHLGRAQVPTPPVGLTGLSGGCVFAEPRPISCAHVATTRELHTRTQEGFAGITSLW